MTYFEFVSVALSLIFALALADICRSIVPATKKAVRYWPHIGWLAAVFLLAIYIWISIWGLKTMSWTGLNFLLAFVNPALITVMARLLTTNNPAAVRSFRDHFFESKRALFSIFLLFNIFGFLFVWIVGFAPIGSIMLPQLGALGGIAISVMGLVVKNDIAHHVLVGVVLLLLLSLIASVPANT